MRDGLLDKRQMGGQGTQVARQVSYDGSIGKIENDLIAAGRGHGLGTQAAELCCDSHCY